MSVPFPGVSIVATLTLGIVVDTTWKQEEALLLKPGQSVIALGYMLTLDGIEKNVPHENYSSTRATLRFVRDGATGYPLQTGLKIE